MSLLALLSDSAAVVKAYGIDLVTLDHGHQILGDRSLAAMVSIWRTNPTRV